MKGLTRLAVFLLVAVSATLTAAAADLTNSHRLDNGLEVRLFPEAGTPLTATLVLVKTGHAVDGPERLGFSHLLEHLVFAGTGEMDKEALFDEVRALGAYLNGFTRDDYMGYLVVGHGDHYRRMMELLSSILFRAALREEDVAAAQKVVVEEIRRRASRPDTRFDETFQALLYEGSPYARTGLGGESTVTAASRRELEEHYRRYYRPGNMILLSAGAVGGEETLAVLSETFGAAAPGAPPPPPGGPPPSLRGRRVYRLESELPGVHVRIGFNGPDPPSGDTEALELLAEVLGGRGGELQKNLEARGFKPRSVSAGLSLHPRFSRFVVSASFPEEARDGAVAALLDAIGSLSRKGIFGADLNRARGSLAAAELLGREKMHYYLMGKAPWVIAGAPGQGFSEERWSGIGAGELGRAAAAYLSEAPYAALLGLPATEKEGVAAAGEADRRRVELDNGLVVIAEERPGSKVFALNVLTRRRSAAEPAGKAGIADLLHRLLPRGAAGKTRAQVEEELREIGANLSTAGNPTVPFGDFYTSRRYSFLRLESPAAKAARAVDVAAAMIKSPTLAPEEVEEVRKTTLDYISFRDAKPGSLASRLLAEALYGPEGFGADVLGRPETATAISPADLEQFRAGYFTGRNMVVTVVSGMKPDAAVELVRKKFGDLPAGDGPPDFEPATTSGDALVEAVLGRPQGALAAGAVSGTVDPGDRAALAVTAGILSDRLSRQLREKEGLAYSVGASLGFAGAKAVWGLSMGISPEKIEDGRSGFRREIEALRGAEVTAEEIRRTVNEMAGRLQMRMLSSLNRGFYLALAERSALDHRYGEEYRQRLLAVTPRQVEKAARTYLPAHLVEAVVR